MNRFQVTKGREDEFEYIWKSRDSHLNDVSGFIEFHLLRGPEMDDYTLFCSHSVWASRKAFEDWTKSEQFRKAHAGAGQTKGLYLGHPNFEGFDVVQKLKSDA